MFWRPIHRDILATALMLGWYFGSVSAFGQSAAPATVSPPSEPMLEAVSYAPIPAGASFETQVNDDGELNKEALASVNTRLSERGYSVNTEAPLVMVIETDLVRGIKQDSPLGQAYVNNSDPNDKVGAKVEARLYSTTQNSLLNPQPTIASADKLYRINLSVYDRASGLYVWRGTATRDNPDTDITQASEEMIANLISHIGQTVKPPAK